MMGRIAANAADYTVITTDNPRREPAGAIIAEIEEGYLSIRPTDYALGEDRAAAIALGAGSGGTGDCVLIAGKGHNMYQEFESTIVPFDDREYVRGALQARRANTAIAFRKLEPELAGR